VPARREIRGVSPRSSAVSVEAYSIGHFSAGMAYNPDSASPPRGGGWGGWICNAAAAYVTLSRRGGGLRLQRFLSVLFDHRQRFPRLVALPDPSSERPCPYPESVSWGVRV